MLILETTHYISSSLLRAGILFKSIMAHETLNREKPRDSSYGSTALCILEPQFPNGKMGITALSGLPQGSNKASESQHFTNYEVPH